MADASYEIAVFGSTPLAALLAGLLASEHHKRVCLIAEAGSAFRVPRGIDLSVMPVTRPETWALLKDTTAETLRLLAQIRAKAGMQRVDPIFAADMPAGSEALSHMRHVAMGFGYAVERLPSGAAFAAGDAYRLRDAVLLRRAEIEPLLAAWLEKAGVGQLAARDVGVTLRRDGTARIAYAGTNLEAVQAVLADDAAIVTYLDAPERDRTLALHHVTALLTEPTHSLQATVMIYPDRGVTLSRNRGGGVVALGSGAPEIALAQIGRCLTGRSPLRRAGQRIFRTVTTADGAPLVGPARGIKAVVIAGLGVGGAFLAPAVARLIAGTANQKEHDYFAAREAGRGNARSLVTDYAGSISLEAQV